jgi:hypothetical protein
MSSLNASDERLTAFSSSDRASSDVPSFGWSACPCQSWECLSLPVVLAGLASQSLPVIKYRLRCALLMTNETAQGVACKGSMGPISDPGSPALSMIGARIVSITWLGSANLRRMHGGLFLFPLEFFGGPAQSRLDHYVDAGTLTLSLETTASTAPCPICGAESNRVHSRYHRALADLPCFGKAVRLAILVRRFFCTDAQCPRRIFAERLLGFARPYSRTTDRLRQAHEAVGAALGGEPGSRLTVRLAISTSPDTLLRRVKQFEGGSPSPPRFVGIDDWAWRKGQRYGTIVVDLERSDIIDLLPDRDATTVKKWLDDHPGVELISRDRSSTYAQAAADSAPNALQVADRWHLLKNLREAIERLFERQSDEVNEAVKAPAAATESPCSPALPDAPRAVTAGEPSSPPQPIAEPTAESPQLHAQRARRRKKIERFEQVHERHRRRHSARRIARELGMSFHTVQRYLRCKECPDWKPGRAWRSRWDAHREGSTPVLPRVVQTRPSCTGNW